MSKPYTNGSNIKELTKLLDQWESTKKEHDQHLKLNQPRLQREIDAGYKRVCLDSPNFRRISK